MTHLTTINRPDNAQAEAYLASLAPSTQRLYATAWERFGAYLAETRPVRVDEHAVAGFIQSLVAEGMKHGSVRTYASGVRSVLNGLGSPVPADAPVLKVALRASARRGEGVRQAKGVTWDQADAIVREALAEDTATGYRDAALVALMSDCLLRAGEALNLNWEDVDLETRTVTIRRSKTDREGVGAEIAFGRATENVLRAWLAMLDDEPYGAVFRRVYDDTVDRPLTSINSIRNILARRAPGASTHSLRVGSAQSLVEAGASTAELAQAGRWTSEKVAHRYASKGLARRSAAVRLRHGVDR